MSPPKALRSAGAGAPSSRVIDLAQLRSVSGSLPAKITRPDEGARPSAIEMCRTSPFSGTVVMESRSAGT